MAVDYMLGVTQRGYDQLIGAKASESKAKAAAADRKRRQGSTLGNLASIGLQVGAAYLTGGASLAYGNQINQMLLGDESEGIAGTAAGLGSMAYGIGKGKQAAALGKANQSFQNDLSSTQRLYDAAKEAGDMDQMMGLARRMNDMSSQHKTDVNAFNEQGFLPHVLSEQGMKRTKMAAQDPTKQYGYVDPYAKEQAAIDEERNQLKLGQYGPT